MTEELPWGSPGTSARTSASLRDQRDRSGSRQATMLGEREPDWPPELWPEGEWVETEPLPHEAHSESAAPAEEAPAEEAPAEEAPAEEAPAEEAPAAQREPGWFDAAPTAVPPGGYTTRRQLRESQLRENRHRGTSQAPPRPAEPVPAEPVSAEPVSAEPVSADPVPMDTGSTGTVAFDAVPAEVAPPAAPADERPAEPGRRGPTTGELELYRPAPADALAAFDRPPALFPVDFPIDAQAPFPGTGAPEGDGAGARVRRGVERWSVWAAGLGLPPRDRSGRRRYVERLFPPAVWLVAALGVAVFVGLLTGVLVSSAGAGSGKVQTAVATATVTVTNAQTTTATATTTRTRTRTVTAPPQVLDTEQGGPTSQTAAPTTQSGGQGLQPGSQGVQVFLLQQRLAQLGLLQGPPTGTYDARTAAAVQNFQARAGVTADPPGVAGPATLQALRQAVGR